ncbi:PcfJ domain-containing protein [Planctomycetota bacterium]
MPRLPVGVIGIVAETSLRERATPPLLREVAANPSDRTEPETAGIIRDCLRMLSELGRPDTDECRNLRSLQALRALHDDLVVEVNALRERCEREAAQREADRREREAAAHEREAARRERRLAAQRVRTPPRTRKLPPWPPPPVPGIERVIVPITSDEMLNEEGRVMHHCVSVYGDKVRRGNVYVYRVLNPRATCAIAFRRDKWVLTELRGKRNARIGRKARQMLCEWLATNQPER